MAELKKPTRNKSPLHGVPTDTITAIATAPGHGAVAIVRVSGPRAIYLCDDLFRGRKKLADLPGGRAVTGWITDGDEELDEVVVTLYRSPRSYTGEDLVEISCHGGPSAGYILNALIGYGARPSRPGEFTKRAFLNGRMDLSQAEAVAALINSCGRAAHRAALRLLKGRLRERLEPIYEEGLMIQSRLEAAIEFPENVGDDEPRIREGYFAEVSGGRGEEHPPTSIELTRLREQVEALHRQAGRSDLLLSGYRCVLAGTVNVGKSSLFNALLNRDRAIVTEEPGTTRDTLEGILEVEGIPVTLVDTAGIRSPSSRSEAEGTRRSREERQSADLVLEVLDISQSPEAKLTGAHKNETEKADTLILLNKSDLPWHPEWEKHQPEDALAVSARTGAGMDQVREAIAKRLRGAPHEEILLSLRQREDLARAARHLSVAGNLLENKELPELISYEIGEAVQSFGGILGRDPSAELMETIFSRFCIGK
ncbi:MAG: tRNA uridine-5-carboxymethylaminomethyl(34) synthesis GTPase MnmE [Candidatus Eisenbacteria bacterium]|uniref:tRNA modification GTPase MnmE n=1 Tax=Eiseniibacteriota bacterium TaxID=2212470 RepID=A0A948S0X6_UNCEI|nr:tRNA uridine-5-carboxymethylaminomethyl(34) synthesis GTPase MnmE [Candidatus Eisenbacteria bacterium]MBU1950310.1 tRNA uridine-5-carboxymethylaminomethyl(34) synthesis GTPase MnmE [Candidatus Eisenbacteria bacterium]MBU2693328.1 tRNA uridine-5-carboxymethylaminomethyl(34) synthesis GTPase MnmE [Candidatus Eisenbacteria bacterium]